MRIVSVLMISAPIISALMISEQTVGGHMQAPASFDPRNASLRRRA
jgi:hypothetical protein